MRYYTFHENRRLIYMSGGDRYKFLQGLITNDINLVTETNSIYTALLSPQGRYLFDFFVFQEADRLALDVHADRADELVSLLNKYKLRTQVEIDGSSGQSCTICMKF
jgi:folate-binding Fe-S cluster repair protein YgfZ